MELTGDQLEVAETELRKYLPNSLPVYGTLLLKKRVGADPVNVFVDKWPKFSVIICKPQYEQECDLFRDIVVFALDKVSLEEITRNSSVLDWSRSFCLGCKVPHMKIITAVAAEKRLPAQQLSLCHTLMLNDISKLPDIDSTGITLGSLNESHVDLVNQTWKFGQNQGARRMIRNMVTNFRSCCVLDAEGTPVSWLLTYSSCAMGMLYTQPAYRGKGYAKVLISSMARKNHADGHPVYCFIEEYNKLSYKIFQSLGFTEEPSYRATWYGFNDL